MFEPYPFTALYFAEAAHQGQFRKGPGNLPYITHPKSVHDILYHEAEIDSWPLRNAALLHDVVEDAGVSLGEIYRKFGTEVGILVGAVTILDGETKLEMMRRAINCNDFAGFLKVADRTANLRDMVCQDPGWSPQKKMQYVAESHYLLGWIEGKHGIMRELLKEAITNARVAV